MDTELRQIRVMSREEDEIEELGSVVTEEEEEGVKDSVIFNPGSCLHTKKFACVFIPCVLPLFYLAGEMLFGVSVLCLMGMYLVEHTSKSKKSSIVTSVISVLALQLTILYSLLPYIWKSLFNIGLVFIYNVFLVLSGGVGLLHLKQLQYEEPGFVVYLEYILFVSYPLTGQFVICYILGPMEKTLFFFNMLSIPGSMFIIIYLLEFLHLVTWLKLLLCGVFPVFLCTCLDSKEVMDFLDFPSKRVSQVRWLSGLLSLFLVLVIMWSSGVLSFKVIPVLIGSAVLGLVMGISAKTAESKVHHVSSLLFVFLHVFSLWTVVFNVGNLFITPSVHNLLLILLMSSLAVLSAMAVVMSNNTKKLHFSLVLILQSIGMVICEHLLLGQQLYSVHYALLTGLITIYVTARLYIVGVASWHVAWLCSSIHCSKLFMCIYFFLPQHALEQGFLLPNILRVNPTSLGLLFSLVVLRLLIFYDEKTVSLTEGVKMCFGIGAGLFLVYDSLILPLWLVLTNQWPSTADAAATLLLLWGLLCLKVSLVQLSHNLDARKLNIVLLCGGVLVEFVQPEFNPFKVCWSFVVYFVSLIWPLQGWESLLAEDQCLPWLLMISAITALVVLVKLIRVEQYSILGRMMISFLVGFPIGLKTASLLLPLHRPPFLCLSYGLASTLVIFLLVSSWTEVVTSHRVYRGIGTPLVQSESSNFVECIIIHLLYSIKSHLALEALFRGHLSEYSREMSIQYHIHFRFSYYPIPFRYSYVGLIVSLLISFFLESSMDKNSQTSQRGTEHRGLLASSPFLVYHLVLHLILAISLMKEAPPSRESLEDTKGKMPPTTALLSSSFLANISVMLSCALGLMCTPDQYWELWVSLCTCIFLLWRPEGFSIYDARRINISPALPACVFLCLSLYVGTIISAFPTSTGILSSIGFCLEIIFLHCALPTYYGLAHALWKKEMPLALQQWVVFCAPANVVLLFYCSTLAGRVLGVLGIASTYWIFFNVECNDFKNTS
ncbi:uncharacterized protein LOC116301502 [Actinia tenebrosa]|uniref:Uncharacterized protein LOC116301502 n=1 Tax=Actinia tenebrosa TaxID=6105 RepID=A0A6P8II04_ACTTE|nr:uncharacterized protein LOC116301502 [Actinia tenebrosa]